MGRIAPREEVGEIGMLRSMTDGIGVPEGPDRDRIDDFFLLDRCDDTAVSVLSGSLPRKIRDES